jgi:dihydrodipicolinate synthase/N-acetylneuraminate lyase
MTTSYSRRELLVGLGAVTGAAMALRPPLEAATTKPMRGIFPILATPYTAAGGVDFEDLAHEVEVFEKWGAHGMAWPQHASGYPGGVNKEERMRGMEVVAKAAKGRKPALLLGVQSTNTEQMLEFARKAEELEPDGLIAMPPMEAKSIEDYRTYYTALGKLAKRPVFIQTSGGAQGIDPSVQFLIDLAKEFPNLGYVKEEVNPVIDRMKELIKAKPVMKAVFSGANGYSLTYEMRFGADGDMPEAQFTDVYVAAWDLYQSGQKEKARTVFASLLLMLNQMRQFRGVPQYIMKKRGVFKTMVGRGHDGQRTDVQLKPDEIAEIDWNFEAMKPYLKT